MAQFRCSVCNRIVRGRREPGGVRLAAHAPPRPRSVMVAPTATPCAGARCTAHDEVDENGTPIPPKRVPPSLDQVSTVTLRPDEGRR